MAARNPGAFSSSGPFHTRPKGFENGSFTLKTHQMSVSAYTTPEEFKKETISSRFGFVFEENSIREIT